MNSELQQYISNHKSLFWYTPEKEKDKVGDNLLVETILNYGSLDDFRELIRIMGIEHVSDIFFGAKGRAKNNYYPEIYNFFSLVLKRYAHRDS